MINTDLSTLNPVFHASLVDRKRDDLELTRLVLLDLPDVLKSLSTKFNSNMLHIA